jgi:hypothetical protein
MSGLVKPVDFEELNRSAQLYPSFLLPTEGTALSLFASGFWGQNDGIHLIRAGLTIDFVDTDKDKLYEMATLMPAGHSFHVEDAYDFASHAALQSREWDVVSVDPFMGHMQERSWEMLYLWLTITRKMLTLTVKSDIELPETDGWTTSYFPRNHRVGWLVMRYD